MPKKVPKLNDVPFAERLACSPDDAEKHTSLGRSTIWAAMQRGDIEWTKVGGRRLIKVASLLEYIGV
jgi:hypothetical protein